MPEVLVSEVTELTDPELLSIANRVARTFRLAAERAVAHHAEPAEFCLPQEADSLEHLFLARFRDLPAATQKAAVTKVMRFVKAPAAVREKRYGDFVGVDFRAPLSVEAQIRPLAVPVTPALTAERLRELAGRVFPALPAPSPSHASPTPAKGLCLRIFEVRCLDETGDWCEWGEDEIYLGATSVDETGDTKKVPQFKVGDFDDGDVVSFPYGKRFVRFNIAEGTEWPKTYFVTMVLAEVDMGGIADFLNKLVEKVKERVISALTAAIGGAIGASGGIIGAVIGAAVGYVIGEIIEWLKSWWQDEIFDPVTVRATIPSDTFRWSGKTDSPNRRIFFKGHDGKYAVTYDWCLTANMAAVD